MSIVGGGSAFFVRRMRASQSFIARHLIAIHLVTWGVFIALVILDGYFDLPHPFSVPVSACVILVGAPFIIVISFGTPAPDASLPQSLRNFIRFSPWAFGALWLVCVSILVAEIVGDIRIRSILH